MLKAAADDGVAGYAVGRGVVFKINGDVVVSERAVGDEAVGGC